MTHKLSKNFTLEEFLFSQTAARHKIPMEPDEHTVKNIQWLVDSCLQPLRDALQRPIRITSGYRPPRLNTMIGGSKTSAHRFGRAADIVVPGVEPIEVADLFVSLHKQFDQVIHEFGRWVHIGIAERQRNQKLTAYHDRWGKVQYTQGIVPISDIEDRYV